MVVSLTGEIYNIEGDIHMSRGELLSFFLDGRRNDIIIQYQDGKAIKHITYNDVLYQGECTPIYIKHDDKSFQTASGIIKEGMIVPVVNDKGEFVSLFGYKKTFYYHEYNMEGPADYSFLETYDCICLHELNEYTYEIFKASSKKFKGRIILIGDGWDEYQVFVPKTDGADIIFISDSSTEEISSRFIEGKVLHVKDFLATSESHERTVERYKSGIFSCDEVMNIIFGMSNKKSFGGANPDKHFYVIRTKFKLEGLFAIKNKCLALANFAASRGYIPLIDLSASTDSFYSDYEGDNIWDKFYAQPSGYQLEEVYRSKNVTLSPLTFIMAMDLYIMNIISKGNLKFDGNIPYSSKIMQYIKDNTSELIIDNSKTLGVLIRGTDYTRNKPKHESVQADVYTVINKIKEIDGKWKDYDYIYLSTEDQEIWKVMKEEFGDRLKSFDQVRYTVKEGEYLFQKRNERSMDGWHRGAEYICVIWLLAWCDSLIASGKCAGVSEAISINGGKYRNIYVYDNGIYENK
ncbi:MAG: hypothetical protein EWM47_12455 [Anaerolineaceae bacterium]|nr:MAG: hypothetical protein EWM47_12455 [Anaerolineaceae bacterium]